MNPETISLSLFTENPDNPQTVTDEAFAELVKSIRDLPETLEASRIAYVTDYVSPRTGKSYCGQNIVIAGNKRLRALKLIASEGGLQPLVTPDGYVPQDWFFDLTPLGTEARRKWLVKSNVQTGEWDAKIMQELYSEEELGELLGADALDKLLASLPDDPETGNTDPDEAPSAPAEPVSKRGSMYQLGDHLLCCGDATNREDLIALMQGVNANLLLTDPPYNVGYVGGTKDALTIENDCMDDERFLEFLTSAFSNIDSVLTAGGAFYIWHADSEGFTFRTAAHRVGWRVRQVLVWVKNSLVLGRQDYQWQHEPCLYGWKDGAAHYFTDDRNETSVINESKPARSAEHPTMKPIALISRLVRNSSRRGEIVLDPFGGSGTTLIACEQLGRICRMMEIDTRYCDVIRRRWAEFRHGEGCDWQALTPEVSK